MWRCKAPPAIPPGKPIVGLNLGYRTLQAANAAEAIADEMARRAAASAHSETGS
jgi:hypothetical protein